MWNNISILVLIKMEVYERFWFSKVWLMQKHCYKNCLYVYTSLYICCPELQHFSRVLQENFWVGCSLLSYDIIIAGHEKIIKAAICMLSGKFSRYWIWIPQLTIGIIEETNSRTKHVEDKKLHELPLRNSLILYNKVLVKLLRQGGRQAGRQTDQTDRVLNLKSDILSKTVVKIYHGILAFI